MPGGLPRGMLKLRLDQYIRMNYNSIDESPAMNRYYVVTKTNFLPS